MRPSQGFNDNTYLNSLRVAVEVLGNRVGDNVGTKTEGLLVVGGHEGVVNDNDGTVAVGDAGDEGDIDHGEGGVGGGLDPDKGGLVGEGSVEVGLDLSLVGNLDAIGDRDVDKRGLNALRGGDLGEVTVGTAVDVTDRDNVAAVGDERRDNSLGDSRARGEGKSRRELVLGSRDVAELGGELERSDKSLKRETVGVERTCVLEALEMSVKKFDCNESGYVKVEVAVGCGNRGAWAFRISPSSHSM
jgi:hypothetical protein